MPARDHSTLRKLDNVAEEHAYLLVGRNHFAGNARKFVDCIYDDIARKFAIVDYVALGLRVADKVFESRVVDAVECRHLHDFLAALGEPLFPRLRFVSARGEAAVIHPFVGLPAGEQIRLYFVAVLLFGVF